ncbi:MAG: type 4a pilus biogenesis protein PilO [Candidatus Omnitrophica bacterium]|nr:type 4a pilus biogenesis protein PilO [Candidatus Omnitrophota bacterium]
MFLLKLKKRERYILYFAIIVIGFFIFDRIVIRPVLAELKNLNKKITVKEKQLKKSLRLVSQKEKINSLYSEYVDQIKQELSDEEEVAKLLSYIEEVAKETNVSLVRLKPSQTKKEDFYKKFIMKIEAEASISRLIDFIYKLEKSSQLIRVDDFRLTPRKQGSSILEIEMSISKVLVL